MKTLEAAITELAQNTMERNNFHTPLDYFSWGRDKRHKVDDTESLPANPTNIFRKLLGGGARRKVVSALPNLSSRDPAEKILKKFRSHYRPFEKTYQMMSDQYSRNLFAELILLKIAGEKAMRLSSFTQDFVDSYEAASECILASNETLEVYRWVLRKITLTNPQVTFFTAPVTLNLHSTGKLYRYQNDDVVIGVSGGDVVIDGGIGWGDTTIYLAAIAGERDEGHVYAFDILEEGIAALSKQLEENESITNISSSLLGLSDRDGDLLNISDPSPGARFTDKETGRTVETITIDTFCHQQKLERVNLIKMDIEGAETPAITGATQTIREHKPKLAISAYHKWDDLLTIPSLIHSIRDDYNYYLDCTTGFGGEAVLYCC